MAMKKSTRLLLWTSILGFLLAIVMAIAVILIVSFEGGLPTSGPRTLVLELEGAVPDGPTQGAFILDEADFPPLLTELTQVIRTAADDEDIDGLYMELRPVGLGLASVQELADALHIFRESGKPCTVQADQLGNKEFLLASACGEVHLAPAGIVLVNGLSIEHTYYAETLEKVGVSPNFAHVGDFKTAVEPFERTGPSEAAIEATDAMLDSLWSQFVTLAARGRAIDEAAVQAAVDTLPLTPEAAQAAGLVDGVAYAGELRPDDDAIIDLDRYLARVRSDNRGHPCVAVIHAEGSIVSGDSGAGMFGGSYVGDLDLIADLEEARDDDDVVAVVLRVNSPGGSGLASDNIWHAVQSVRDAKPVVVSMGDYAASGGYYIAMGSDHIVAQPGTLTGSIGVFGGKMNLRGAYEKLGMHLHGYKRGELADIFSSTSDFSEDGRARFEAYLDTFYQLFLGRAAEGRGMSVEEMHAVAQGRVWTGAQALERGLVDDLGGLDVAIAHARELAGVEEETGILRLPRQRTFVEELMDDLTATSSRLGAQQPHQELMSLLGVESALQLTETLARVLGPNAGVAAMPPYQIEVQ
jgi:protease IV